jgi:hypothetical protein
MQGRGSGKSLSMTRAAFCSGIVPLFLLFTLIAASPLAALTPEDAAKHVGEEGTVEGLAAQVSEVGGNVYINMGARFPQHTFTAFVGKEDVATVGLDYLKSLEGKTVSVVGKIGEHKGKPQIRVRKKEQIIEAAPVPPPATE